MRSVDAVLVLIGPRWLEARIDGARRLDDPADFVRQEVATALASGKPVIPLLVGGALMPGEADLPAPLAGLARRQAVVLSDGGWQGDVARLVASLRPLLGRRPGTAENSRRWLVGGAALLVALGLALLWLRPPATAPEPVAQGGQATAIAGHWAAPVKYDWGASHDEVFEFRAEGSAIAGHASYLGRKLAIEQASVDGEWLRFVTRSQEVLGGDSPPREVVHRYAGRIEADAVQFTLESGGGYSQHSPVSFVARRVAPVR